MCKTLYTFRYLFICIYLFILQIFILILLYSFYCILLYVVFYSCGELSADDLMHLHSMSDNAEVMAEYLRQLQESYSNNRSQLNIIFDVIGTPSDADIAHLDHTTSSVLRNLDKKDGKV